MFRDYFLNFIAAGMTTAHPSLVHMETGRSCSDMLLQIVDYVVAVYVDSWDASLFIDSDDNEICSLVYISDFRFLVSLLFSIDRSLVQELMVH